jgi:hypothetical protein
MLDHCRVPSSPRSLVDASQVKTCSRRGICFSVVKCSRRGIFENSVVIDIGVAEDRQTRPKSEVEHRYLLWRTSTAAPHRQCAKIVVLGLGKRPMRRFHRICRRRGNLAACGERTTARQEAADRIYRTRIRNHVRRLLRGST